jgi:putative hydrolase of the HAD superfamily
METDQIKIVAFDADDTLWDCQGHFDKVMQQLYTELEPWVDRETAAQELFATERKNMPLLGFGAKAFTLSMLETAMRVSHYEMTAEKISEIQQQCYRLLQFPCTPLPEVSDTITTLRAKRPDLRLICFTKGELLDQEHKLQRSGLAPFFDDVEITSDKGEKEFRELCHKLSIAPEEMLMVGNSMKSDIAPALTVGCSAVYIPFHITWELETAETVESDRLVRIEHFSELLTLFP